MASNPQKQNPAGGPGFAGVQTNGGGLRSEYSAGGPLALLLSRLDRVRKAGKGYSARCPAHPDKTASLSLCEGSDGRVLIRCFAGCDALAVVQAVGLRLADLFAQPLGPLTFERRQELKQYSREANWQAALAVVGTEAAVVEIAAGQVLRDDPLNWTDYQRLALAADRIAAARKVLK